MNLTLTHRKNNQKEAAMITTTRVTAREARPRRVTSTLLWAAQILLAAFFVLIAAGSKLAGSHSAVQEFGLIGAGQWLRYLVGTAELAGAIGLLTPWLAGPASVGLAANMAGATIINATVLRNTTYAINVWLTALLCAVFVLLAYGRRQQIKSLTAGVRRVRRRRSRRSATGLHEAARRLELVPAQLAPVAATGEHQPTRSAHDDKRELGNPPPVDDRNSRTTPSAVGR